MCDHEQDGLSVMRPEDSWEEAAVVSDCAISDHSSVGVKYALLAKPLMYIRRREGIVSPGTFGALLYDALPHLDSPASLESLLKSAWECYPYDRLEEIATAINAYPGSAAQRIRAELYRLLEMPPAEIG